MILYDKMLIDFFCNVVIGKAVFVDDFKNLTFQKQPPELFYKKDVLKNSAKFTEKHLCVF